MDDMQRYRDLWAGVLDQAIMDITTPYWWDGEEHRAPQREHDKAIAWLCERRTGDGSFIWICIKLGLDPDHVQKNILERVLEKRVLDLTAKCRFKGKGAFKQKRDHDFAMWWFGNGATDKGSFEWVCRQLDKDPVKVRGRVKGKRERI